MKRDIDLVRDILLSIEDGKDADGHGLMRLNVPGRSREEVSYHVGLLYEAGLVDAANSSALDGYEWQPGGLVWRGREFLDSARDEISWERAKEELRKTGNFSFEVLKVALAIVAARNV